MLQDSLLQFIMSIFLLPLLFLIWGLVLLSLPNHFTQTCCLLEGTFDWTTQNLWSLKITLGQSLGASPTHLHFFKIEDGFPKWRMNALLPSFILENQNGDWNLNVQIWRPMEHLETQLFEMEMLEFLLPLVPYEFKFQYWQYPLHFLVYVRVCVYTYTHKHVWKMYWLHLNRCNVNVIYTITTFW